MPADASAPPRPGRPSWVPDALYPFTDRYVEIEGAQVHYVDQGEGPPLLMLHGNPTWSFLYRQLIDGLSVTHRCIALDLPGFGLSRPPRGYGFTPAEHARIVEGFSRELELRELTLMVQDWGGPIGFAVATRSPERFHSFVLANTWAWPRSDPVTRLAAWTLGGPAGRRLIANRNAFVEWVLPALVRRRPLAPEIMQAYRGPFPTAASRRPIAVLPREFSASRPFLAQVERGLGRLSEHPALILWPTRDPAFRAADLNRWQRVFRRHETILIRGAGHYIQEDAPEELVAAIRGWKRA